MEAPEGYKHTDKDGRRFIKRNGEWVEISAPRQTAVPAPLAEYAGGVNRSMAQLGDFFTTSPVNAISGLMGSDFRVPTLEQGMEAATGGTSGFMEPGTARDVVQAAGEWTPAFANPDLIRQGARSVGNAFNRTNRMLERAAPEIGRLKSRADDLYQAFDDMNVTFPGADTKALTDDILKTMQDKGLDPMISPKAQALATRIASDAENPITLKQLETIRRIASGVSAGPDPHERMLAGIVKNKIDDFYFALPDDLAPGVGDTVKMARQLTQQRKKAEVIEEAIDLAGRYQSGFENGLRLQFNGLSKKIIKGTLRGFTEAEKKAIREVADGGKLTNALRIIGKMGPIEGGSTRTLIPGLGGSLTYMIASQFGLPPGTAAATGLSAVAVGQAARNRAAALTAKNARLASAIVRAGPNGRTITSAYLKTVPRSQQSAAELASLFYSRGLPTEALKALEVNRNAMVANAAVMAQIMADEGEDVQSR